mmetsp:Transcript_105010/g.254919  ORF Transcript_105010/g.254919 Transcript_105010/m.254919 type:complete len:200 (-) Transcript_105010:13-612(-)
MPASAARRAALSPGTPFGKCTVNRWIVTAWRRLFHGTIALLAAVKRRPLDGPGAGLLRSEITTALAPCAPVGEKAIFWGLHALRLRARLCLLLQARAGRSALIVGHRNLPVAEANASAAASFEPLLPLSEGTINWLALIALRQALAVLELLLEAFARPWIFERSEACCCRYIQGACQGQHCHVAAMHVNWLKPLRVRVS